MELEGGLAEEGSRRRFFRKLYAAISRCLPGIARWNRQDLCTGQSPLTCASIAETGVGLARPGLTNPPQYSPSRPFWKVSRPDTLPIYSRDLQFANPRHALAVYSERLASSLSKAGARQLMHRRNSAGWVVRLPKKMTTQRSLQ
jgi:hypothetical protein